ncbi:MAG: hypothetical protein V3V12_08790 [Gammaproteobacteria bacterium]
MQKLLQYIQMLTGQAAKVKPPLSCVNQLLLLHGSKEQEFHVPATAECFTAMEQASTRPANA